MMITFFFGMITLHSWALLVFTNNIACILQNESYTKYRRAFWAMVFIVVGVGARLFYYANHFMDSQNFIIKNPIVLAANVLIVIGLLLYRKNHKIKILEDLREDTSCILKYVSRFFHS